MNAKKMKIALLAGLIPVMLYGTANAAPTSRDGGITVAPGVTVRTAPFHVKGSIPAVCFAADVKSQLDATLPAATLAAAGSILDAALAFAVADFDAYGILASERHGSSQGQGSTTKLVFGSALSSASLSIAATTTNAGALAYAAAVAKAKSESSSSIDTDFTITVDLPWPLKDIIVAVDGPTITAKALSGAFAGAGAFGAAVASASSLAAAGNLAVGANLSYAEGANLSKGLFGVGFASKGFNFAASQSEASASTGALAGVLTYAATQAGLSVGADLDADTASAAANAAATAFAKAMTKTEVKAGLGGIFVRVPGKPDVFEAGGVAKLNVSCGAGVELEVEATASAE
jgi:hypothetical protein